MSVLRRLLFIESRVGRKRGKNDRGPKGARVRRCRRSLVRLSLSPTRANGGGAIAPPRAPDDDGGGALFHPWPDVGPASASASAATLRFSIVVLYTVCSFVRVLALFVVFRCSYYFHIPSIHIYIHVYTKRKTEKINNSKEKRIKKNSNVTHASVYRFAFSCNFKTKPRQRSLHFLYYTYLITNY